MTFQPMLVAALFVTAVLGTQPGWAQEPPTESRAGTRTSGQTLDFTVDLFGGYDDNLGEVPEGSAAIGSRSAWGGNALLMFQKRARTVDFHATGNSSARRDSISSDGLVPGYSGSVQLNSVPGQRIGWTALQSFSYGPTNVLSFLAGGQAIGLDAVPTVDYRITDSAQFSGGTRGELHYGVSRRGTISGYVAYGFSQMLESSEASEIDTTEDLAHWEAGARYSYQFSRYANWYAGYGQTRSGVVRLEDGSEIQPRLDNIDAGLAYNRPLSFSRRTQVSAHVGGAVVEDTSSQTRTFRATGSAALSHGFARSWLAEIAYDRDSRFVPSFAEPVLSDGVTARLGGQLSRKSTMQFLGSYSSGSFGVATGSNSYRTSAGSVNYRYLWFDRLATYVEYFVLDFDFGDGVDLGSSSLGQGRRHGIRFGFSIGTNLLNNGRRGQVPAGDRSR